MPLSHLPTEIILDIADYLEVAGTNALACTNSNIYDLLIKKFYRQDVDKDAQSRSLTWAAENGVIGTIQRAVDVRQYFNRIPDGFHIALQVAAGQGHVSLVELILTVDGIDPNFRGGSSKSTPLSLAAREGHSAVVELLLAAVNIDPNVTDLSVTVTDQDLMSNLTPLTYACWKGHVSIVRQLLARDDIDVNILDNWAGRTALHWAVYESRCLEIVNLLLEKDYIDPNVRDVTFGCTALNFACDIRDIAIIRSLLSHRRTNPNTINTNGASVLADFLTYQEPEYLTPPNSEIESLLRAAGARVFWNR